MRVQDFHVFVFCAFRRRKAVMRRRRMMRRRNHPTVLILPARTSLKKVTGKNSVKSKKFTRKHRCCKL